ncbi:MAG TPA: amino acid adenylation domain-containing protein [Methylocystis sp.]|nr:amino acid adenylation domain-containing protein [Methylocystis sp.]
MSESGDMGRSPTAVADPKANLSATKLELLRLRLSGKLGQGQAGAQISPRPESSNPLSFGQERMLFQLDLEPNTTLFHIPLRVSFAGRLDINALEASLNAVIERHEVLRSSFVKTAGAWSQRIASRLQIALARIELGETPQAAQQEQVDSLAAAEARKPFDLAAPPLMRATLITFAPERCTLLLTIHHIVWDGWSSFLLIREIKEFYKVFAEGGIPSLAPLKVQYADFAHWQRQLFDSELGEKQIDYWRRRLADLPPYSALPTDRPRPATQRHRGDSHSWRLPPKGQAALSELARKSNTTLFVAALSAFYALLFHLTGQDDFALGTTIAYRARPELEKLVGFFTNVLVIRASMRDNPTFEAFLGRVHDLALEAQSNQDAPFEKLVDELSPQRSLSSNPLFQIAFVLHNLPDEMLDLPGLGVVAEEISSGASAFDLVLHVFEDREGLRARFEYDCDLFDRSTIESLASRFDALLLGLKEHATAPIRRLSLLTRDQEAHLLKISRTELEPFERAPTLLDLIGRGEAAALAVSSGGETLTYEDLEYRSNQLAHALIARGVGPEVPVGVLIEPSVHMIVAILGVLKAGGVYVPFDPSYPAARIDYMLSDCKAAAILTTRAAVASLSALATPIVLLDEDEPTFDGFSKEKPSARAHPENLAYIIYTSGSSGQPKGVMVSHRNAASSTQARQQYYRDRVSAYLLLSSIAFDSSVAGIFWTLAHGGTLCIPTEAERRDPAALLRLIEREKISHLLALPSLYAALQGLMDETRGASLKAAIVAGEECKADVVARHFEKLPQVALFNEYGPTECSVWNTVKRLARSNEEQPITIGRPIPGAQTLCFGPLGSLAPIGAAGELLLGGEGVARGYNNRPDLTAELFVPNPHGGIGARAFRSGDLGRLDHEGDVKFLGRIDDQTKIRGYRVELREIEAALAKAPDVEEAIVFAQLEKNGARRLVAYVRGHERDADLIVAATNSLSHALPDYMIPERIVVVTDFPRLPNGKIDRAAASRLEPEAPPSAVGQNHSRRALTQAESLLAEIWQDVLAVETVDADDDFFDIGGNSLSAIQVTARIQELFAEEIPVTAIFDAPKLSEFAREIERVFAGAATSDELDLLLREIETGSNIRLGEEAGPLGAAGGQNG